MNKKNSIGSRIKVKTKSGKYIDGLLKSIIKRSNGKDLMLIEEWHLINNDMLEDIK